MLIRTIECAIAAPLALRHMQPAVGASHHLLRVQHLPGCLGRRSGVVVPLPTDAAPAADT
jgi:hypothetical protein